MSDDGRSAAYTRKPPRRGRRVLVVSNASPETSSEEDVAPPPPPNPYGYPRPLPTPSRSLPSTEQFTHARFPSGPNPHTMPPPLTTNIYPSSRSNPSNPALSSPSSTSSPAVESTPPPSTPGLSASTIQFNDGEGTGTFRQEMFNPAVAMDRYDSTPQASRPPRQFVRSQANAQAHERRYSSSGSRPATVRLVSLSLHLIELTNHAVPNRLYP